MVGRAYTMKEMKLIVDYIVEHRVYNEVRGRKMWMDLAHSKILDRTWQSLKETFLKRILHDIHNPYFKLSVEQISSFRNECDIEAKNKNKLEILTISEDSSTSDKQRDKQAINKEDEKTGEDKCFKIQNRNRSSTDTLVLENCYETAEDILKELESPSPKITNGQKSLRDFITYSEPLTPMLQEVLHDFTSDDELPMQIVEEPEAPINFESNTKKSVSPETIRESQSYSKPNNQVTKDEESNKKTPPSKIKSLKLKKTHKGTWENKELVNDVASTEQEKETNNNCAGKEKENEKTDRSIIPDKNNSSCTNDTPLPNNQEELASKLNQARNSTESSNSEYMEPHRKKKEKSRKRSHSQSSVERKKKKKETKQAPSETRVPEKNTQTFDSHPQATTLLEQLAQSTPGAQETTNNQKDLTDDTNIPPNMVVDDTTAKSNEGTSQEAGPSGVSPADINPCLQSVSLFAEQFNQSKYSDSDEEPASQDPVVLLNSRSETSSETKQSSPEKSSRNNTLLENNNVQQKNHEQRKTENHINDESKEINISKQTEETPALDNNVKATTSKKLQNKFDDIVLLKSHSESSSEHMEPSPKHQVGRGNKSREEALSNVFGFSSGGVHKKVNHSKTSSRRHTKRHRISSRTRNLHSGSSDDYTTASDSDDVPPSGRNIDHGQNFAKPSSYDILSHENGLFVVGRKKIYPLVLRENGSLHYAWASEGQNVETDSYWKTKYFEESKKLAEEKIRADELARLLRRAQDIEKEKEQISTIQHNNQSLSTILNRNEPKQVQETVEAESKQKPDEKVKIKFNRNKEVELEGQWTNLNPILERMVELFKPTDDVDGAKTKPQTEEHDTVKPSIKSSKPVQSSQRANKKTPQASNIEKPIVIRDSEEKEKGTNKAAEPVVLSSGKSTPSSDLTPTDSETNKKIDNLESEIFEKIAELDKTTSENDAQEASSDNVTKRKRGRPRKISPSIQSSAASNMVSKKRSSSTDKVAKKARELSSEVDRRKPRTISLGPYPRKPHAEDVHSDAGNSKRPSRPPTRYESELSSEAGRRKSRTISLEPYPRKPYAEDVDSDARYSKRPSMPPTRYRSELSSEAGRRKSRTISLQPYSRKSYAEDIDSDARYSKLPNRPPTTYGSELSSVAGRRKSRTISLEPYSRKSSAENVDRNARDSKRPSRPPTRYGSELSSEVGRRKSRAISLEPYSRKSHAEHVDSNARYSKRPTSPPTRYGTKLSSVAGRRKSRTISLEPYSRKSSAENVDRNARDSKRPSRAPTRYGSELSSEVGRRKSRAISLEPYSRKSHAEHVDSNARYSKRPTSPPTRYGTELYCEAGRRKSRTISLEPYSRKPYAEDVVSNARYSKRPSRPPKRYESELSSEADRRKSRTISLEPYSHKSYAEDVDSKARYSKRPTRPPTRYGSESNLAFAAKQVRSRSTAPRAPAGAGAGGRASVPEDDDDRVRYKFPPTSDTNTLTKSNKNNRRYSLTEPTHTFPATRPTRSTYSDYQDSDITPPNITKRKRKMSTSNPVYRKGLAKKVQRKSSPYLADDDSCSTNEAQSQKSVSVPVDSRLLNSEVYRSESYNMLMPKTKQQNHQLDIIDEDSLAQKSRMDKDSFDKHNVLAVNLNNEFYVHSDELPSNSSELKGSEANSSNVSLPLSPEISVVENLSVSKDLVISSYYNPTINETQTNHTEQPIQSSNKLLISDVDVSMPLMEQDCEFKTQIKTKSCNRRTTFSESFPREQCTTDSLDQKLGDLLLESAKKIAREPTEAHATDNLMEVDVVASEKKTKDKKRRSSTPRKKKTVQRSKTPVVEPVLEERTESCSRSGRKSCPPLIHVIPCEEPPIDVNTKIKSDRGRKKKDVIKVKILRPRSSSHSKDRVQSKLSVCTDSGINDTESAGSDCYCCDVSTELIHNHSDTCLHMDECVGDSVEIIEDMDKSIISVNSNSIPSEILKDGKSNECNDLSAEFVTPEIFCSNAQDATNFDTAKTPATKVADDAETVYHTPSSGASFNSIITDDLSVELPPSCAQWYLLSDAETNSNAADAHLRSSGSIGAHLNKIFTPFAVPDLSTISERSKESDSKTALNTDIDADTMSQSLFDLEFLSSVRN